MVIILGPLKEETSLWGRHDDFVSDQQDRLWSVNDAARENLTICRTTKENMPPDGAETEQTRHLGLVLLPASLDGYVTDVDQTLPGKDASH